MRRKLPTEAKVGVFVLLALALLAYITIDVSQLGFTSRNAYTLYAVMSNAEGVTRKTPVQVAGIPVGFVETIELLGDNTAKIGMKIRDDVKVALDSEVQVRVRGVLGDTYLEIIPGEETAALEKGGEIMRVRRRADYQDLFGEVSEITENVKDITESLNTYTATETSHVAQILKNMEVLTANMAQFSNANMANMNAIVVNLRALTEDLKNLSGNSGQDIQEAIQRISDLTEKIERGEGTLGKLINDEATIEKTNKALDNIVDLTQGFSRLETEIGWHLEYLGGTGDVKNYVSLVLQPRPDKYFLFEVIHDPAPPPSISDQITTVTAGGVTSVVVTETQNFDNIRFSAELAKKFKDITLRGGLIESTGGVGLDYNRGPFGVQFSAFDFTNDRPHLKILGQVNLFPALYLLGGFDDFINTAHDLDWFLGAGIRLTDRDVKSLVGGASLAR
jgi:phospholipid/cholesterol/gamma-HCH transport system substrate-binding protein